ncbi:MAG: MFS transporter [Ignavibacteria bacterium]|nr:MFS transporter [Ignavibacteria bacterium]
MKNIGIKGSLYLNYFVFAILLNTVGIVILQVINDYNVSRVTAGSLEAFKDLSIMILSFFVASYIPKLGYKRSMLGGLLAVNLVSIVVALVHQYWVIPLLYIVTGASFAFVKVSVYSTVGLITQGQKEHTSFMNILEGIFQIGSLTGPIIFSFMIGFSKWTDTYWIIAVLTTLALLLMYFTGLDESSVKSHSEKTNILSMIKLLKEAAVWVFVICAFLYVMIEQSLNTWLPTFNKEIFSLSEARTAALLAIFPASIAVSRLLAGYYAKHISWIKSQLILLSGAFIIILTVLLITSDFNLVQEPTTDAFPLLAIIILLTGFFIGPIYPTIVSIILNKTEKVKQSSMTGLIVVFSAFGGTSGSLIIGLLSQNYSVHTAFYFPLIPITLLGLLLFPYKKLTDKYGSEAEE